MNRSVHIRPDVTAPDLAYEGSADAKFACNDRAVLTGLAHVADEFWIKLRPMMTYMLAWRESLQVIWIHAKALPAEMMKLHAFRHWSSLQFIDHTMGSCDATSVINLAVARCAVPASSPLSSPNMARRLIACVRDLVGHQSAAGADGLAYMAGSEESWFTTTTGTQRFRHAPAVYGVPVGLA